MKTIEAIETMKTKTATNMMKITQSLGRLILAMLMAVLLNVGLSSQAEARKTLRKVQEVNFGDMSLKGTIRSPDGAFLVQKRGIKFLPLYDVQKDLDWKIRDSVAYIQ